MTAKGVEPGLFESLRRLSGTALGMLHSRLSLASLELGAAGERVLVSLLMAVAAALLAGAAVFALSVWLAFVVWDRTGPAVIAMIALAYAVAAAALLWRLRSRVRTTPPLLADTLAELRRDAQLLRAAGERDAL